VALNSVEMPAAAAAPLLMLQGLSKAFGPVQALRQVDLTLGSGELLGLVGHNGAGKSTLMNILMGMFPPDSGRLGLDGAAIEPPYTPALAHRLGIRCVFQEL
jgi:ribose transport system ATP-binding protein